MLLFGTAAGGSSLLEFVQNSLYLIEKLHRPATYLGQQWMYIIQAAERYTK